MTFSTPELSLNEVLNLATKYGYDGIEPRVVARHKHGIETDLTAGERQAVRERVGKGTISLGCIATSCRYADPATNSENVATTRACIDLAADLGAPRIRVFGGQIGGGLDRDAAIALVADSLSAVALRAEERGIVVCMETHDDWCNPAHVAAVIKRVNHPNIAVNWDILHPVRTNNATIDESIETLRPWIKHVHVHDQNVPNGDLAPIGTGFLDHKRAIELLHSIDYDGYISGEWIDWSDPYESHLPRELATMRGYESAL